jgi:hypothetical protein
MKLLDKEEIYKLKISKLEMELEICKMKLQLDEMKLEIGAKKSKKRKPKKKKKGKRSEEKPIIPREGEDPILKGIVDIGQLALGPDMHSSMNPGDVADYFGTDGENQLPLHPQIGPTGQLAHQLGIGLAEQLDNDVGSSMDMDTGQPATGPGTRLAHDGIGTGSMVDDQRNNPG